MRQNFTYPHSNFDDTTINIKFADEYNMYIYPISAEFIVFYAMYICVDTRGKFTVVYYIFIAERDPGIQVENINALFSFSEGEFRSRHADMRGKASAWNGN